MLNMLPSPAEHPAYTLQLPHDPRAPSVARATVGGVLTAYGLDKLADTATLLACELVTNAYEHSHGPSAMRLRRFEGRFRVSVWDADPYIPVAFRPYLDLPGHANDTKLCADRGAAYSSSSAVPTPGAATPSAKAAPPAANSSGSN